MHVHIRNFQGTPRRPVARPCGASIDHRPSARSDKLGRRSLAARVAQLRRLCQRPLLRGALRSRVLRRPRGASTNRTLRQCSSLTRTCPRVLSGARGTRKSAAVRALGHPTRTHAVLECSLGAGTSHASHAVVFDCRFQRSTRLVAPSAPFNHAAARPSMAPTNPPPPPPPLNCCPATCSLPGSVVERNLLASFSRMLPGARRPPLWHRAITLTRRHPARRAAALLEQALPSREHPRRASGAPQSQAGRPFGSHQAAHSARHHGRSRTAAPAAQAGGTQEGHRPVGRLGRREPRAQQLDAARRRERRRKPGPRGPRAVSAPAARGGGGARLCTLL